MNRDKERAGGNGGGSPGLSEELMSTPFLSGQEPQLGGQGPCGRRGAQRTAVQGLERPVELC